MKTMTAEPKYVYRRTLAAALAVMLVGGGWCLAQTPKLAEQLLAAQQTNPDILAAEAKVRLAQAELEQVRVKVAREIIAANWELQTQRVAVERAEAQSQAGKGDRRQLIMEKAKLEELEASMPYILGKGMPGEAGGSVSGKKSASPKLPPKEVVEQVAAVLDNPTELDNIIEMPLLDVADFLRDYHNLVFLVDGGDSFITRDTVITINTSSVPLGAALEALEDTNPPLHFVIRGYGILITSKESAIAEESLSAVELWREKSTQNVTGKPAAADKKPMR